MNRVRLAKKQKGTVDGQPAAPSASPARPRAFDVAEPVHTDTVDPAVKEAADWMLQHGLPGLRSLA